MTRLFCIHFIFLILASPLLAQVTDDSLQVAEPETDTLNVQPPATISKSEFQSFKIRDKYNCLYHTTPSVDITICGVEAAGSLIGLYFLLSKPPVDENVILNLNAEDIIPFNRSAIHEYNPDLSILSNAIFIGGILYGTVLLFDDDIRMDVKTVGLLYTETMLFAGIAYTVTASSIDKLRPYAYNNDSMLVNGQKVPEVPMEKRTNNGARNSFYAGHPGTNAAASFFVASVYATYHPHSSWKYFLYGVAVATTASAAYVRYKTGHHFPTDIIAGVALGTSYGLVIPALHRCKKMKNLSVTPFTGMGNGINMQYTF